MIVREAIAAVEPSTGADSDDDDERQIAEPVILPPAFSVAEIIVANDRYAALYCAYIDVKECGLYNAVGKNFLQALTSYLVTVVRDFPCRLRCLQSTACGKIQPGGLFVRWKTSQKEDKPLVTSERYADFVVYDCANKVNVVVFEIKTSENEKCEVQHNEQMDEAVDGGAASHAGLQCVCTEGITQSAAAAAQLSEIVLPAEIAFRQARWPACIC